MSTEALMRDVLQQYAPARRAQDGDCLVVAPKVTQALINRGLPAQTVNVAVWLDHGATTLVFVHKITLCDDWALDATAQQYHPLLPALWVAPIDVYLEHLAAAIPGVDHASVWC